jgi:hypothetical protein
LGIHPPETDEPAPGEAVGVVEGALVEGGTVMVGSSVTITEWVLVEVLRELLLALVAGVVLFRVPVTLVCVEVAVRVSIPVLERASSGVLTRQEPTKAWPKLRGPHSPHE